MTNRITFKYNKKDYEQGIELTMHISFINKGDNKMDLLSCTISNGYNACDYSSVADITTLLDIIKEYMHSDE